MGSLSFVFQERKEGGKRGRKPGRKASTEKIDMKAKLGKFDQNKDHSYFGLKTII